MIPREFIDEVVARTNIVELVGSYVALEAKGKNHWGLCPFHLEKSPSFSVAVDKQMYKCFGCGEGGGAINFVMKQENLPFVEAVAFLAKEAGMTMPEQQYGDPKVKEARQKILDINKSAAQFFYQQLYQPGGKEALEYLVGRRLGKKVLTDFGLGYAPNGWDSLIKALGQRGYSPTDLVEAGLAIHSEKGRIYDRFRNRVMFPIISVAGDVIGFGGRVMDDSKPKYLNSPDTPVFDKGRHLFGLNLAKGCKGGCAILTEGYMDTIALHQGGFPGAVASLGTSLTSGHAQLLAKYFKESVLAYDSDSAGVKATARAIPLLEQAGISVRVLQMDGAKDPDEYLQTFGSTAFTRLLEGSDNHIDYRLGQILQKYDMNQPEQQVAYLRDAVAYIATLESPVEREIYGNKVAGLAGVTPRAVAGEVAMVLQHKMAKEKNMERRMAMAPAAQVQPESRNLRFQNVRCGRAEEELIRIVLKDETLLDKVMVLTAVNFSVPLLGRVFELLKARKQAGLAVNLPCLAGELDGGEMSYLIQVSDKPQDPEFMEQALMDCTRVMGQELEKSSLEGEDFLKAALKRKEKSTI